MYKPHSLWRLTAVALATTAALSIVSTKPANALAGPTAFGNTGDAPLIGDWDGLGVDEPYGTDDVGAYRPGNRTFYLRFSSTNTGAITWGNTGTCPSPGIGTTMASIGSASTGPAPVPSTATACLP